MDVARDYVYFLTQKSRFALPIIPPPLRNHGNAIISLNQFVRWLAEQAEASGIDFFTGFAGQDVLTEGSRVVGVRTGAYSDPPDREGTAALCARVLDRGTSKRSADVIADELDGRGASLSVIAGRHQMALAATCLAEDFEPVLALAADVARHPAFKDSEIATRKEQLITAIRQEEDNPATVAGDAFARALYGTHAYARKVRGTITGLESIRRQDLVRFHQKGFDPPLMTVVVVGDIVEDLAIAAITKLFGDWPTAAKTPEAGSARAAASSESASVVPGTRNLVTPAARARASIPAAVSDAPFPICRWQWESASTST